MSWLWQGAILVVVGVLLRRILHMNAPGLKSYNGLALLSREQARIYDLVVRDLEIEAAILGVALNDAIEEREAGNNEIAWRLVRLAASEWDRLAGATVTLLSQMSRYLPVARLDSPRRMLPERFKSKTMVDYVRFHEMLTQFVFHSKLRFQLHLRVLRRPSRRSRPSSGICIGPPNDRRFARWSCGGAWISTFMTLICSPKKHCSLCALSFPVFPRMN